MSSGDLPPPVPRAFLQADESAERQLVEAGLHVATPDCTDTYRLAAYNQIAENAREALNFWLGQEVTVTSDAHRVFSDPERAYHEQRPTLHRGPLPGIFRQLYVASFSSPDTGSRAVRLALELSTTVPKSATEEQPVKTLTPIRDVTELGLVFGFEMN